MTTDTNPIHPPQNKSNKSNRDARRDIDWLIYVYVRQFAVTSRSANINLFRAPALFVSSN